MNYSWLFDGLIEGKPPQISKMRPSAITGPNKFARARAQEERLIKLGLAQPAMFRAFTGILEGIPDDQLCVFVPPGLYRPNWNELASRIVLTKKPGISWLEPEQIRDDMEIPRVPIMLRNVYLGREHMHMSTRQATEKIEGGGRKVFPMWWHYIVSALFPHWVTEHYTVWRSDRLV